MSHPCWVYHDTEDPKVVDSDDQERLLAEGWRDHPARDNLPTDEMTKLREQAAKLGITVDGRWRQPRLEQEIDAKLDELDKSDG